MRLDELSRILRDIDPAAVLVDRNVLAREAVRDELQHLLVVIEVQDTRARHEPDSTWNPW